MNTPSLPTSHDAAAPAGPTENLTGYSGAAEILGIRIATLRSMVCRGQVPFYRVSPRMVRFAPSELRAWCADKRNLPAQRKPSGTKAA